MSPGQKKAAIATGVVFGVGGLILLTRKPSSSSTETPSTPDVPNPSKPTVKVPRAPTPDPALPPRGNGAAAPLIATNVPKQIATGDKLPTGWSTYGWYSYQGNAPERMWIRVDKGPWRESTVTTEQPWRWTVFVDRPVGDPAGHVPIATALKSFSQIDALEAVLESIGWEDDRANETMGWIMPILAADWIDAAYGS